MADKIKESVAVFLGIGFLAFVAGIENYNLEMRTEPMDRSAIHSKFNGKKVYCKRIILDSAHAEVGQQRIAKN